VAQGGSHPDPKAKNRRVSQAAGQKRLATRAIFLTQKLPERRVQPQRGIIFLVRLYFLPHFAVPSTRHGRETLKTKAAMIFFSILSTCRILSRQQPSKREIFAKAIRSAAEAKTLPAPACRLGMRRGDILDRSQKSGHINERKTL
jgi:hypothetical protein